MGNWIEFASIKQAVPLMRVLQHYHIAGLRRSGKDQWRGRCPLHGGEGREAFHVNTAQQLFHCFSCGAGGTVLDLVAAIEHCGVREAAEKLAVGWGVPKRTSGQAVVQPREATVTKKKRSTSAPVFSTPRRGFAHPYVSAAAFPSAPRTHSVSASMARPGLLSRRLVIPIHNEAGQLVAYCGRSLDGTEPRYKFPTGFAKSQRCLMYTVRRSAGNKP